MRFDWEPDKAVENLRDHHVSLEEAGEVFNDPNAVERFDAGHSIDEDRFNIIGFSSRRLLFVVFVERAGDVMRIISARKATRSEQIEYEQTNN